MLRLISPLSGISRMPIPMRKTAAGVRLPDEIEGVAEDRRHPLVKPATLSRCCGCLGDKRQFLRRDQSQIAVLRVFLGALVYARRARRSPPPKTGAVVLQTARRVGGIHWTTLAA